MKDWISFQNQVLDNSFQKIYLIDSFRNMFNIEIVKKRKHFLETIKKMLSISQKLFPLKKMNNV